MSFNRSPYDVCAYPYDLAQSMGTGVYYLGTPANACMPCHSEDPYIRHQRQGVSISKNTALIDIDSELIGITRNLSRCPSRKYLPTDTVNRCGAQPAGNYTQMRENMQGGKVPCQPNSKLCIDNTDIINFGDCFTKTEDTRLSNPPQTLRCTGWNRWEWLWNDPQYNVHVPFDFEINTRLVAKDNHRPCLPRLKNMYEAWPTPSNDANSMASGQANFQCVGVLMPPRQEPSISWQSQANIQQY
jgi:hypothetical protein